MTDKNHLIIFLTSFVDGKQQCDVVGGLSPDSTFTIDDVERWFSKMPVVTQVMNLALHQCFPVSFYDAADGFSLEILLQWLTFLSNAL